MANPDNVSLRVEDQESVALDFPAPPCTRYPRQGDALDCGNASAGSNPESSPHAGFSTTTPSSDKVNISVVLDSHPGEEVLELLSIHLLRSVHL